MFNLFVYLSELFFFYDIVFNGAGVFSVAVTLISCLLKVNTF